MIYVITHKDFDKSILKDGYKTLQVGAYKGHIDVDVYDDSGDNISEKNTSYCELTGIYWIWKNCTDEYIGITHYRRYFSRNFGNKNIASYDDLKRKLKEHDCIVPFSRKLKTTVKEDYCESCGYAKDIEILREIIGEKYPDYLKTYDEFMQGHTIYFFNMMVTNKELFDEYCTWLFDILFELEKRIDTSAYDQYHKRIYGFLSERMFNIWIDYKKINTFQMGVINTEENWSLKKRILTGGKRFLRYLFF